MKICNRIILKFMLFFLLVAAIGSITIYHLMKVKNNIYIITLDNALTEPVLSSFDAIREQVSHVIRNIIIAVIFLLLAILVMGYCISRSFSGLISKITKAVTQIKEGNMNVQNIELTSANDEMSLLIFEFNKMAYNLMKSSTVLQERTQELLKTNTQLEQELKLREKADYKLKQSLEDINVERKLAVELGKKAEEAGKAKNDFLANMSHEIRTPMTAILGFSDMLTQTPLNMKQEDYVLNILSSGKLLLDLINNILDFSKIESGKIQLEEIDFNLGDMVTDILNIFGVKVDEKYVCLYGDIAKDVPLNLRGDPTRLRQIFVNLIGNAIKFTRNGEIGVIVNKEENAAESGGIALRFIVKDTGIGIENSKQDQIFDTFTQEDTSITRKFGGTGLGLAICKSIVEAMRGKIWVESKKNKGSEFVFIVEFKEAAEVLKTEIYPLSNSELKEKKVFIVDDNEKAREILINYCEDMGMMVLSALDSGRTALQKIEELSSQNKLPDIMLCDIMMPEMDGYEVVKTIRQNDKYRAIKIISVSSNIPVGTAADLMKKKGFNGFLSKPIILSELKQVIAAVLGDKRKKGQIITRYLAEELNCKGIKVLVAEDNIVNQKLIMALLNAMGCVGDYVSNGKDAIERLKFNKYDLCLMDVQMPEMGGIEATQVIRKEISQDFPIVALTAAATKEDQKKCLSAGMNNFLIKPINKVKLKEIIFKYGRVTTKINTLH